MAAVAIWKAVKPSFKYQHVFLIKGYNLQSTAFQKKTKPYKMCIICFHILINLFQFSFFSYMSFNLILTP